MMFAGLSSPIETEQTAFMASLLNFFEIPYVWTGIEKRQTENTTITAYPNPFREQLTFSLEITESSKIQVVLYDLSGRQVGLVYEEQVNPGTHELRIPDAEVQKLQSGVYFGRVFVNDNISTTKLIKW